MADLRFDIQQIWNDMPHTSIRHLIYSHHPCVHVVLAAEGDFTRYWHFFLQLQNFALNVVMKLLGLKLDSSHRLNSRFRGLTSNRFLSDFNEICNKYAQRSHVYTEEISYYSRKTVIQILMLIKSDHNFFARSVDPYWLKNVLWPKLQKWCLIFTSLNCYKM